MQERLTPPHVQEALSTVWLGRTYRYMPSVSSTNSLLKEEAAAGACLPAGTVLLADFQEHGRGRMARSWEAPPGSSLLFSIFLRPGWTAERLAWLTMIAGLAVSEAVEQQCGLEARLKWPNDCVLSHEGMWRKYGGILLEGHLAEGDLLEYAVAGIGVNVNLPGDQLPEASFPATSLLAAAGRSHSRLALLSAILARFEHHYDLAQRGRSPLASWRERLIYINQPVTVSRLGNDADLTGLAVGTDALGRLLVRDEEGHMHHIAAGDVTVRQAPPSLG